MTTSDVQRSELLFKLGMSYQLLLAEFVSRMNEAGYGDLRPIHGYTFQILKDGGMTSSDLAQKLGITKQGSGQIVDYLAQRGYVERRPHPGGGRRKLIFVTDRGWEHLRTAGRLLHELEAELAQHVGTSAMTELRAQLDTLLDTLGDDGTQPFRPG
ncbi:MarR family winged helix-turn-helix transcriptional regulator [Haloglycomyces albus]|uniref:MarR family winged helix-turn-helix transcriptional regulator n=1 Tax=Haloglycomyces albus TaxID=526067 RepID=UPI00046CA9E4|nr:MarR family transcriptional regulator [Haloglycomyces albus]